MSTGPQDSIRFIACCEWAMPASCRSSHPAGRQLLRHKLRPIPTVLRRGKWIPIFPANISYPSIVRDVWRRLTLCCNFNSKARNTWEEKEISISRSKGIHLCDAFYGNIDTSIFIVNAPTPLTQLLLLHFHIIKIASSGRCAQENWKSFSGE